MTERVNAFSEKDVARFWSKVDRSETPTTTKEKSMSKSIPVHIYFVLDRSGSMAPLHGDVVGGINKFLADQKAEEGKCRLSMIQFDGREPHEILYDAVDVREVPDLTPDRYQPRGATPLLDAEGWMINRAEQRERERKEGDKKQEAILFVTFTDGFENASREWTYEKLNEAKKDAEDRGWTFTYLGTGHDSYDQGSRIGTNVNSVQDFAQDGEGVAMAMASVSEASVGLRSAAHAGKRGMVTSDNLYDNAYYKGGKKAEADKKRRKTKSRS